MVLLCAPPCFEMVNKPTYLGRTLSEWLDEVEYASPQRQKDAVTAVRNLGTACIPALFRMLRSTDSPFKKAVLDITEGCRSGIGINRVTPIERYLTATSCRKHRQAVFGFQALRQLPTSSVVELVKIMCDDQEDGDIRLHALSIFLELEDVPTEAILVLRTAARDASREVKVAALDTSGKNLKITTLLVQQLTDAVKDKNFTVRLRAARTLGVIGVGNIETVSNLVMATRDPNASVRAAACLSLSKIAPNCDETAGALLFCLHDPDFLISMNVIQGLLRCDKTGTKCVVALCRTFRDKHGKIYLPRHIKVILETCYPELLARLGNMI